MHIIDDNGNYIKIVFKTSDFINKRIDYKRYESLDRYNAFVAGTESEFEKDLRENHVCDSLLTEIAELADNTKSIKDNLMTAMYNALKTDKFPNSTINS